MTYENCLCPIWTNYPNEIVKRVEAEKGENPGLPEDELYYILWEENSFYLDEERENLDIQLNRPIIILGDIGRWNGRVSGYKMLPSGNVKDCLYSNDDYISWFIDKNGDLIGNGEHHDGSNHYRYRVFRDFCDEEDISDFQDLLYYGKATEKEIEKYTERLGDIVANVYGFQIPEKKGEAR